MSLAITPIPATIVPERMIGAFKATITIEELATDTLTITKHPVQKGVNTTDHAYLEPATLNMKVVFDESTAPLAEIYENLRTLQASIIPFNVVTGKRQYSNMLIASLGQTTDALSENILNIALSLQEIKTSLVETTSVPARAAQRDPGVTGKTENAGTKNATRSETKTPSALKSLIGG